MGLLLVVLALPFVSAHYLAMNLPAPLHEPSGDAPGFLYY